MDGTAEGQALPRTVPHGEKPLPASGLRLACETPGPQLVVVAGAGGPVTCPARSLGLCGPAWPRWHPQPCAFTPAGKVGASTAPPCRASSSLIPRPLPETNRDPKALGVHTHLLPPSASHPIVYFPRPALSPGSFPNPHSCLHHRHYRSLKFIPDRTLCDGGSTVHLGSHRLCPKPSKPFLKPSYSLCCWEKKRERETSLSPPVPQAPTAEPLCVDLMHRFP